MMSYSYTQRLALTNFINALLTEWTGFQRGEDEIVIGADDGQGDLVLPLLKDSVVQRFSFAWPAKIRQQGIETPLSYQQVVAFICAHKDITGAYSAQQIAQFQEQVLASEQHMAMASATRSTPASQEGFITAEQSLLGGHNLHPASKTHQGWDAQQAQAYSPDYGAQFALHWYFVKAELIAGESADEQQQAATVLAQLLRQSYQDAGITVDIPEGFLPYPVHPHQAQVLAENSDVQQYLSEGRIIDLQAQGRVWLPTSSTRALWQQDSRWMLKFSLAVKLTNSIRHLSPTELSRGILFQQVSNDLAGAEFQQRFPDFKLLQEPAWCGLKDLQGDYIVDSLFCWRDNPYLTGKEPTMTLAALTQESADGSNGIAQSVQRLAQQRDISTADASAIWLEHFLEKVIKPLAVARSDYGMVMLAHQQNILVTFEQSLPVGGAFRDCQGTGFTDTALTRFKRFRRNKPAYFLGNEGLNPYFSYYLVINSLNSVIAALSTQLSIDESRGLLRISQNLWRQLAQHGYYDDSFYQYLLQSQQLKIKGNFFCFLSVDNETELADASNIYVSMDNPYRVVEATQGRTTFKPLFLDAADRAEKRSGLNLVFHQQQQQLTVASNWQQWQLQWQASEEGGYVLSQHDDAAIVQQKMSPQQWLHVIEYCFGGLIAPSEDGQQDIAQWIEISEQAWHVLSVAAIPEWVESRAGLIRIKRGDFFQYAGIWNKSKPSSNNVERVKAENGSEHPLRPAQPEGVFFQRYIYPLQRVVSFKCADVTRDAPVFSDWHNTPSIARMWELKGSLESHREYLTKQTESEHSMAVIGYFDGVPFGYFEVYWAPEDRLGPYYDHQDHDRGIHMLVGNRFFLGNKNFINWSTAILHATFREEANTQQIMGEPRADNHHVVRITENIGMVKLKEFDFPHKRAALMCCDRSKFFDSII